MIYEAFEVVTVPFPFTDTDQSKRRPVVILSSRSAFNESAKHSIMAMITSATHVPWPCDVPITDLHKAGLSAASVVRLKLFTLDHRLIVRKIGRLSSQDQKALSKALHKVLP